MFELRTLGTIDLRGEDGGVLHDPLLHSKRLALLAFLAASYPSRLHRRDTLTALLWPELDASHARGTLRHELYELRRVLRPGVLLGEGGEAVGIDAGRLWCDARAFDEALDSGCLAEALELWHGEFLPGLHVRGGEFHRWLDRTRDRLGRRAINAAERLLSEADRCDDEAGAIRWARQWTQLAPYDETATRRLIALLDRAGDRAGAVSAYDALRTRLREELDIEPSPETCALVARVRDRGNATTPAGATDHPESRRVHPAPRDMATVDPGDPSPPPVVIAVQPVENLTGEGRRDILAHRLTDRLVRGLSELTFIEVATGTEVPGATAVVSTRLYGRCDRVEACTRLVESGTVGRVLAMPESVVIDADPGDPDLDGVVARVLAAVAAQYDPRVPIAFVAGLPDKTPSWQAFLEFMQGSEAFGAYRFEEAARRLRRAYEMDPGWAKAGIFAAIARAYCGDPEGADALATAVMSRRDALTPYERYFGEYLLADLRGRRAEAYRAAKEASRLTTHPVLRTIAGREALRMNRPAEAVRILKGGDTGLGWWRNWAEWYEILGGAYHVLGDHEGELESVLRGRSRLPEALEPLRAEVRARAALHQPAVVLDLVDEALSLSAGMTSPATVAWTAAQELEAHHEPDAGAAARGVGLTWFARHAHPVRAERLLEIRMLLEAGEVEPASARLRSLAPPPDLETLGLGGILAALTGDACNARLVVAQLESLRNPYLSGRHFLLAAEIHAGLDEPVLAREALRRALTEGLPFGVELHALPGLQPLAAGTDFPTLLRPRG